MAAAGQRSIICRSRELTERGRGFRFAVLRRGEMIPAFVVRFNGVVHGYLNRCAHRAQELDWPAAISEILRLGSWQPSRARDW